MERIEMSQEERDKLEWLKRAKDGVISQREAARRMGVTDRWVRKLLTRMKRQGDRVVVHGLRGAGIQPENRDEGASAGDRTAETAGLARLWTDVRQRATGQAARHRAERRDAARMDDRGRIVEARRAPNRGGPLLAAAAQRVWRTGAVGHIRARLAGRTRAGALPGAADRRCDQLELGPLREARRDAVQHGRAVGVSGEERADGGRLYSSRIDVRSGAARRRKRSRTRRRGSADTVGTRAAGTGHRLDRGVLAAGQGPHRT